MRELKFRVWRSDSRGFYYFPLAYASPDKSGWTVMQLSSELAADTQQYTGLKDKNGKEIYEGDIVQIEHYWKLYTYLVEWEDDKSGDGNLIVGFSGAYEHGEVIGNIYESPGLLGGTPENPDMLKIG